jgi:hypothetical protein
MGCGNWVGSAAAEVSRLAVFIEESLEWAGVAVGATAVFTGLGVWEGDEVEAAGWRCGRPEQGGRGCCDKDAVWTVPLVDSLCAQLALE